MSERSISTDFEIPGVEGTFELWIDSSRNWWLYRDNKQWDESGLNYKQLAYVADYIDDWLAP